MAWAVLALGATALSGADWPQWRGPNRDGVSAEADWSVDWPATGPKRLWTAHVGEGTSSVAVVGNRVYTLGRVLDGESGGTKTSKEAAMCLDADTGKVLWSQAVRPVMGNYSPHSTPTVDSGRVYVYATGGELLCLDGKTGQVLWENRLAGAKPELTRYGHAVSPLLVGSVVVVACNRKDGTLFGLDSGTGAERWHSEHIPPTKVQAFWASPVAGMVDGKLCVVYHGARAMLGVSPADGTTQWRFDFTDPLFPKPEDASIASTPILCSGRVFASYRVFEDKVPGRSFCLEVSGGKPRIAWETGELWTAWHSSAALDGFVYAMDESRTPLAKKTGLRCYNLATGELKWSAKGIEAAPREAGRPRWLSAAPLTVAGKRMISYVGSDLVVTGLSPSGPKTLAAVDIGERGQWTVPVLANGRLYLRATAGNLMCFDVGAPK
jgi:outer membrane protein assembly factor BamB